MTSALEHGLFLRGAISIGDFYETEKMAVGAAVFEAADYYKHPEWIGISAAPSLAFDFSINNNEAKEYFLKYDIPLKAGAEKDGWAYDWTHLMYQNNKEHNKIFSIVLQKVYEDMVKQQDTTDITIARKWRNTLAFYNYAVGLRNRSVTENLSPEK